MRFDVVTLFPELFEPFLKTGITRRAYEAGQVDVHLTNPRDYSSGNYRRVDDRPFGGGPGMVMMAEPLAQALAAIRAARGDQAPVVLFSPIGQPLNHAAVQGWAGSAGAILLCGRYEGIDQRFIDAYVDVQISLGDFVLSGGEIAAMALLDAVARLQPGCCPMKTATTRIALIQRWMACSTVPITHALRSGMAWAYLRYWVRATMKTSSAGAGISDFC